ncbi:MAG TPA: FkbM family methyltransferase [Anaerolineales bacterium]|nr:FkbM family methyltransferase [Chloroflexota bacterium]NOG76252.1 FkbM family methyltransferase [Chloroflexota bacterium]WKZ52847.1 MAG: FkbM family methyltransferase [Anaerolineales bacterium]GIK10625.1 MAG: hypothetical protein BroJett001_26910 [Chloroflexota bacterium]HMN00148.1 FkbM family methyltransferase [Anaerolineales bacterium]
MLTLRQVWRKAVRRFLYRHEKSSYALNQLDKKLAPYMDFNNGFFIEVGANNGVKQSNTLYFEKYMGWRGLLIEAIPDLAEQCRKNRPRCIVENCALVAADYSERTIEMQYCNLMSIVKGGLGNPENEATHIKRGKQFLRQDEDVYTVLVPACVLSDILDKYGISKVDFLSLDVEGYEHEVLKGLDFSRHRPRFMLIEVRDRLVIEEIISHWYQPIAILNLNPAYQDILYEVKGEQ